MSWTVMGAPLNSSAEPAGEAHAPAALRRAGLVERLEARDDGDIAGRVTPKVRDRESGVLGLPGLLEGSVELRDRVAEVLGRGERPLVVGGDCSLLLGVGAALQRRLSRPGLWFVDGHTDTYDAASSPTGEAADMELAVLTGHGPAVLASVAADEPMVAPERVVVLGHRHPDDAEDTRELELIDPAIRRVDARALRARGCAATAEEAERELRGRADGVWLHVDLDVLDAAALPSVSYPQGGGLDWDELAAVLGPLAASRRLVGMSVADLNADLDRDGRHAERVVDLVAGVVAGASPER